MRSVRRLGLCAVIVAGCARTVVPDDAGDGGVSRGDGSLGDAIGAGFVSVHADPNTGSSLGAAFWRGGSRDTYEDCRVEEIGACVITDCDLSARITTTLATAGTITAGGASVNAVGAFYTFGSPNVLWQPGDTIEIRATGTRGAPGIPGVPSFRGTVVMPEPLRAPSLETATGAIDVPRDQPFALEWSATDSLVAATIRQSVPRALSVSCVFDGRSGSGEIPTEAIAELQRSGSRDNPSVILIAPISRRTLDAGGYEILLEASGVGVAASAIVR